MSVYEQQWVGSSQGDEQDAVGTAIQQGTSGALNITLGSSAQKACKNVLLQIIQRPPKAFHVFGRLGDPLE